MMRKVFFAVLTAITVVSAANASSITYSIVPDFGGPGTFALTASTSAGDNFGLSYYAVELTGAATIRHVNVSPMGTDFDNGLTYGFGFARSADNVSVVSAAQDITGGGFPVYGIGQTAGTLKSFVPTGDTFGGAGGDLVGTYGAPVVLATGTYLNDSPPRIVANTATGFVFTSKGTESRFGPFAAPTSIFLPADSLFREPAFTPPNLPSVITNPTVPPPLVINPSTPPPPSPEQQPVPPPPPVVVIDPPPGEQPPLDGPHVMPVFRDGSFLIGGGSLQFILTKPLAPDSAIFDGSTALVPPLESLHFVPNIHVVDYATNGQLQRLFFNGIRTDESANDSGMRAASAGDAFFAYTGPGTLSLPATASSLDGTTSATPEPATISLFGLALFGAFVLIRRRA